MFDEEAEIEQTCYSGVAGGGGVPSYLLQENDDFLLQENDDKIIL